MESVRILFLMRGRTLAALIYIRTMLLLNASVNGSTLMVCDNANLFVTTRCLYVPRMLNCAMMELLL